MMRRSFPKLSAVIAGIPPALQKQLDLLDEAQQKFSTYKQEDVDEIFRRTAQRCSQSRIELATLAVEETQCGVLEDKVIKNHFACENVLHRYGSLRTCGVIEEDTEGGITKVAYPVGPVLTIIPMTNPTSTTLFKSLIGLKTRNAILVAPHPRAVKCSAMTTNLLHDTAVRWGAPKGCIQMIDAAHIKHVKTVMCNDPIKFIWATGGPGLVKACYSSGKPTIGVGAGNNSAVIDETANIKQAVSQIVISKTFDSGMICAAEQNVVVVDSIRDQVREEFIKAGAYFLTPEEEKRLTEELFKKDPDCPHHISVNPKFVGMRAHQIAELIGVKVPSTTTIIMADMSGVPFDVYYPMASEKLCTVLGFYSAPTWKKAQEIARDLVTTHGIGHTCALHTKDDLGERVRNFEQIVPAGRILVDMPSAQGAIGDLYNFKLEPSMSLGCGTLGGNSFNGQVTPTQLLNIKTTAHQRENMQWLKIPPRLYFKSHILEEAFRDLAGEHKHALIVTDPVMVRMGTCERVEKCLKSVGIESTVFSAVLPDPDTECIKAGVEAATKCSPDLIIGLGGGSPIDASKIIRLLYEHPEIQIPDLYTRFLDIRKRVFKFPNLGSKVKKVVCIPTTSGTGAEVTPFAVITDAETKHKYPIASYRLTPEMAIVDGSLVTTMPAQLAAATGLDALTHALESYVSVMATSFTKPNSFQAIQMSFDHLVPSCKTADPFHREAMHHASTIAGIAFGNAFLGICHSMAHQLGGIFHIPHGLANAYCLSAVIRYNAYPNPTKRTSFSQYIFYRAPEDYAEISVALGFCSRQDSTEAKVAALINAIENMKKDLGVPSTIQRGEPRIAEADYLKAVHEMAVGAFDDQCTGCNPRFPLVSELEALFKEVYYGQ